jgi:cerevisin
MLSAFCLSLLITSVVATPLSTPHDIPSGRSPLALAPFHTLQVDQPEKVLNHSYIVMLKDDLHSSAMDNHFNFLQAAHEEDPLLADGPVGISQVYNGHLKGYAGRFTDAVIQRIREMPEVAYVEQDSIVEALETQTFAPWVRFSFNGLITGNNTVFRVLRVSLSVRDSASELSATCMTPRAAKMSMCTSSIPVSIFTT